MGFGFGYENPKTIFACCFNFLFPFSNKTFPFFPLFLEKFRFSEMRIKRLWGRYIVKLIDCRQSCFVLLLYIPYLSLITRKILWNVSIQFKIFLQYDSELATPQPLKTLDSKFDFRMTWIRVI